MAYDAENVSPKVDVNVVEILRLADFLERLPRGKVDMHRYVHSKKHCNTTACIAGWAVLTKAIPQEPEKLGFPAAFNQVYTYAYEQTGDTASITCAAANILGINKWTAYKLFHDFPGNLSPGRQPSQRQVVRTLRHLALTGEVKWDAV